MLTSPVWTAPPAPLRSGPLCSSASQLLWQSLTSRDRASPATAPRLPDADRRRLPNGRSRDLPVPAQGASAHARVFDHAGSSGARDDALGCVAFHHMHGVGTQDKTLSRLDGWPMRSPVNASPRPSRAPAHDSGPMWIATPSSQGTCTLYSLPVSRRLAYVFRFAPRKRTSARGKVWPTSQQLAQSHATILSSIRCSMRPSLRILPTWAPHRSSACRRSERNSCR